MLDQRVDAVLVERQGLHVGHDGLLEILVFALLRRRQRFAAEAILDVLILQATKLLIGIGDAVEGLENLRLQLRFHGRKRHGILHVVLVVEGVVGQRHVAVESGRWIARRRGGRGGRAGRQHLGRVRRRHVDLGRVLPVRARIGRLEIDDLAQQNLRLVEFVAPDDDGLERQRTFAKARDHRFAAGLDPLGDGDLALARQKFDRTHLAQVHAHGIVGPVRGLAGARRDGGLTRRLDEFAAFGLLFLVGLLLGRGGAFLGLFAFDDADPHLAQHGVDVFDLVGGHLFRRQHGIEFVMGHEAAALGGLDHTLDGGIGQVEQRSIGSRLRYDAFALDLFTVLFCHRSLRPTAHPPWGSRSLDILCSCPTPAVPLTFRQVPSAKAVNSMLTMTQALRRRSQSPVDSCPDKEPYPSTVASVPSNVVTMAFRSRT